MIPRALRVLLWALALGASALFVLLALGHLRYPGELDYIEGVMLDHVVRVLAGRPLYVAPSLSFIPLAYMPGFTLAAALVAHVVGTGLLAGRLVSLAGSLVVALLAGLVVRRETRSWTFAVAAAGIYLMGYGQAGGGHYDVARPDSLMLALALGGLATLRFTNGRAGAIAAAALLVAAFFTKQHAVWFGLAALAYVAIHEPGRRVAFGATWLAGCAGGYALLSAWLGPWFVFFTWDLPAHWSTLSPLRIERYVGGGLLGMLGPLTVAWLLSFGLAESPWRGRGAIWAWLGLAGVGTGLLGTLDPSAWRHVFMPSMMTFAVLGPLSLARLAAFAGEASPAAAARARGAAWALLVLQFVPLVYSSHNERPHHGAVAAHAALLETIRATPGPVLVVEHGFYTWQAGKGTGLQQIALGDLERSRGVGAARPETRALDSLVVQLASGPGRPTLVTDEPLGDVGPFWALVTPGYRLVRDLGSLTEPLRGFAGHLFWPRYVYAPVEPPGPAPRRYGPRAVP